MSVKKKLFLFSVAAVMSFFGLIFLAGIIWSVVPIFGNTLPHHLAEWSGVSFKWSALLVSALLGVVCVGCITASAVIHALATDTELDW
ncbi:hypothetical protein EGM51_16090 [Verrucomicrobia bacterium S94]|nr:hypothetical protein EGM51_16090 [Verrucomicrobia bacterium S94]